MQDGNWKKIKSILHQTLELETSEREKFLRSVKADEKIIREVRSMLDYAADSEDFLSVSVDNFSQGILIENGFDEKSLVGKEIGEYEIVGELGFGGMGAVYLAERNKENFTQMVAVKMLRREFNTEKIRKRFRKESEIQGKLVHPNIATLLDAGTTDDGVPFLVMEYVEGIRIDDFCNEKNLGLNERLKIFNKVCEAVSFAHRNLIIHRDIKHSNILVNENGEPKLLDFGISKLIDESGQNTKSMTMLGAMTPDYASPEQIKGESVTTATDIYSLGVVLYKLLTGTMPYDTENKTSPQIFREITNSQPTIPSEAIFRDAETRGRGDAETKEEITASPRRPVPASQLKGDLDNIILKSLRKEPERRYETVEQFAADIWRFIDGLPVLARPATFGYKAQKFYTRNKIQVIAAGLIILSLLGGISVAVWQARVARQQAFIANAAEQKALISERNALNEAEKSKIEEERAKKVTAYIQKVLNYANPHWVFEGAESEGQAKVIDVVNELSTKIEEEFPNDPDIRAILHHSFTEIYMRQAVIEKNPEKSKKLSEAAIQHSQKALADRKKYYGEKHELIAKDMYYYYNIDDTAADKAKRLAEAIQMMRETNPKNINLPYMLMDYSTFMFLDENSDPESLSTLLPGEKVKEQWNAFYKNAIPKPNVGRLELAEQYMTEAESLYKIHYPQDHAIYDDVRCKFAHLQIEQGEFKKAKENTKSCGLDQRKLIKKYATRLEKGLRGELQ